MENMFAGLSQVPTAMNLPRFETRKALIIINMQNDSFYVKGDLYITKNHEFVPRLKEMIPYFRNHGDVVWVNTHMAAPSPDISSGAAKGQASAARQAQKEQQERNQKEQQNESEEAGEKTELDSTDPNTTPENMMQTYYASSKTKGMMNHAPAGSRAEKRTVDAQVFDDKDNNLEKQINKRRKGQQIRFYIAGTRGAEICDGLADCVDELSDLIVIKRHYSAFDETSLLMALRQRLVTEVYLCGCLTNVSIYSTAADAVQHGLQVTVVENCLGYRNEDKHEEAMRQMADIMGVHGIDSEEIIEEAGGRPIPDADTPGITLDELSLGSPKTSAREIEGSRSQQTKPAARGGKLASDKSSDPASSPSQKPISKPQRGLQKDKPAQPSNPKPIAKGARSSRNASKSQTLGPSDSIGSGDSKIIYSALASPMINMAFIRVREEVGWQTMFHRSGEVPRLVAVQGEVGQSGEIPVYRHPADESPPLLPFTPMVQRIRKQVEQLLSQSFNHALIQLYRNGVDNISEHSDKTLDIVRGSVIVNVSIGAERIMTLRMKKSEQSQGPDSSNVRQTQRIKMPHNSVFVLGPQTNQEWLHGVRADKRPSNERTEEEKAFGGERISITFRQIGTFMDKSTNQIWGAGAKAKDKASANKISTQNNAQMEDMIIAFGRENHNPDFDWDAEYGQGFDVVNLINEQAKLTLCSDSVANLRVQLALCEKAISFTATGCPTPQEPAEKEESKKRFHTWMHGLSNSDNPIFQDVGEKASKIEGDLAIMFYLETTHPFPHTSNGTSSEAAGGARPSALMYTQMGQSNELLFLWRELRDSQQGSSGSQYLQSRPTNRFRLERPITPDNMLHQEFHAQLKRWEGYAGASEFMTGDEWGIIDCAFWPVLNYLVEGSEEVGRERYPGLLGYWTRGTGRESVRAVLARRC